MTTKRHVILHFEENGYWVEVPSLPGCYSQEDTKEAIELHIESLIDAGDPVPEETPVDEFKELL